MKRFFFFINLFLVISNTSKGQSFYESLRHFTTHDGLSNNTIRQVFQDNQGFIWFCTDVGLNRYDGYEFKTYELTPFDSCSISNNNITAIAQGPSEKLWVSAFNGGLYLFDPKTECFQKITIPSIGQLNDGSILKLHFDATGILWIVTEHLMIKRYDPKTRQTTTYGQKKDFQYPTQFLEDISGRYLYLNIWNKYVKVFDKENLTFVEDSMHPHLERPKHYDVQTIIKDVRGNIWLYRSNDTQIEQIHLKTGKTKTFPTPNWEQLNIKKDTNISHFSPFLFQGHHGIIWKNTAIGLLGFDPIKQEYTTTYKIYNPENNDTRINTTFVDNAGLVWIGTKDSGCFLFNPEIQELTSYPFEGNGRLVYQDRQEWIWITDKNKLEVFLPNSDSSLDFSKYFKNHFDISETGGTPVAIYEDPKDDENILWISIVDLGLLQFDKNTKRFIQHLPKDPENKIIEILDIIPDKDHMIWLACNNGLQRFNTKTHEFEWFKHDPKNPKSIPKGVIRRLLKDTSGNIWVGSRSHGLARFDPITQHFSRFAHDPNKKESLSNNNVQSFLQDSRGNIWIGTYDGGLNLWNQHTNAFEHYTKKDGLPSNVIRGILEDDKGNIWLVTAHGLSKFDPNRKTFTNYDQRDGILQLDFLDSFQNKKGKIFLGAKNGAIGFYPDRFTSSYFEPPVVITELKISNRKVPIHEAITNDQELTLSYKESGISFKIAALSYYNAYKNQFAYKLEGIHNNWIQLDTNREIIFPTLNYGEYTLHIIASNWQGVWNEKGLRLKIVVLPPFWDTVWFQASILLIAIILTFLLFLYRIKKIQKQKQLLETEVFKRTKELEEVNQIKDRFFAIISHDLQGPLISFKELSFLINHYIKTDQIDKIIDLSHKVDNAATRLHDLLNNLLNWSMAQQEMVTITQTNTQLSELVEECTNLYAGSILANHINLDVSIPEDFIVKTDYNTTSCIIRNIMSNAIKFTKQKGIIQLKASKKEQQTILMIKDSGTGMEQNTIDKLFDLSSKIKHKGIRQEEGNGLGLILCKEFARLNNITIAVESKLGQGTAFYLNFNK